MQYRKSTYIEDDGVMEILMPPASSASDPVEDEQHQFIRRNWESFAAAAYEGFRRYGVGALVVSENPQGERRVPHPFAAHSVWYATTLEGWTDLGRSEEAVLWWREQTEAYDPREACLFVFLREGEPPRLYRVQGSVRPVEALTRMRSMLN